MSSHFIRPAASSPGLTRRALLGGSLAGLTALTLSACGGSGDDAENGAAASRTGEAAAGGTLRIARPAADAAETLDPASSLSAYEYLGALYNRLVKQDEEGQTVPDLAEDWDSDSEVLVWTFRLRSGVEFHDGAELTADDVVYTMRHILDPDVGSPQADALSTVVQAEDIHAEDDLTVRFELTTPNAEFPSLLTSYHCYIIPEGSASQIGETGIGTGPFQLESFEAAGAGRVIANENYFEGRPTLDEIEFNAIQDATARVNALLAGQVDLISQTNLDFPTAQEVQNNSGTTVARVENAQWYTIPMLYTSEQFSDPQVREAMKLAYDPETLLQTALQGEGSPGWDNPVPPHMAGWLDPVREYDPERAASLLADAGMENFSAEIVTSSYDANLTPIATAYAEQVAEAGIDLQINNVSSDSFYTEYWMQTPLMVSYFFTGRPMDQLLNQIFRSGSGYNESLWENETFDSLLDEARADTNDESRLQKYQDAQRMIVEEAPHMTPMFGDRLVGISESVINYREFAFEFDYLNIGLEA
ncbi:ABC transporter substrate-binding protein [Nesterenkonia populi]